MKKTIEISYSDLRNITNRIIDIVYETTGYKKGRISISTSINNEIGVQGDDWDYVLIALQEKEGIVLEGFNFYDYFYDEGQLQQETFKGIFLLSLRFILYIFLFKWTSTKFKDNLFTTNSGKPNLTVGDLITSKIEGKFVKRHDRIFKINKNCAQ